MSPAMFTSCPAPGCSEWGVQVFTEAEKVRVEVAHRNRLHPHTLEAVAALATDDPMREREKQEIEAAILVAARANGGRVSANTVRPLLPAYITPQLIGPTFLAMSKAGGPLVRLDREPSTDKRSRNTHHDHNVYVLREMAPQLDEAAS